MNKLAEAMTQEDPMAKCLKDQLSKGYKQAQAGIICNALKKKYATKEDDNIFLMAFNDEADLNEEELGMMNERSYVEDDIENGDIVDEGDIGDVLPSLDKVEETVTIELPVDTAEEIKVQLEEASDVAETVPEEVEIEIKDGQAIVSTDYYYMEKGYGEEYLSDDKKVVNIDLNQLGLVAKDGELVVKLIYGSEEFANSNAPVNVQDEIVKTNVTEIIEQNITREINETDVLNVIENITTLQYKAVINRPVKWIKTIKTEKGDNTIIDLPKKSKEY